MGNGVCLCEVIEANVSDAFSIFRYVVDEDSRQHVRTNEHAAGVSQSIGTCIALLWFLVIMLPLDRLVYTQVCNLSDCSPS